MFRSRGSRTPLKTAALLATVAVSALALSACGSGESGGSSTADSGAIEWWGWNPEPVAAQAFIEAFNKDYPDITVTYKQVPINTWDATLRPVLASGQGPDVFNIAPSPQAISMFGGSTEDLTPIVEDKFGADWKDTVAANGPLTFTNDSGKLTGLSVGSTYAGTLWINKDLFDSLGLTAPTTLDEWKSVCATLRDNGHGCFTQGVAQTAFNQDTLQAIADSVEPGWWEAATKSENKWDDQTMVDTLTIWKELFDEKIIDEGALGLQQYPDANNNFLSGKSGIVMMGTWYTPFTTVEGATAAISASGVADAKPFTMIPVHFPDVAGKGNKPVLFGDANYGLSINNKSSKKDAAATFVTWLAMNENGQQAIANRLNDIPSLNGVQPDWNEVELVNRDAQQKVIEDILTEASASSEPRLSILTAKQQEAIGQASTAVAEGTKTPAQAAKTLQETWEK